jgi:signal transduction histidine kinase
MHPSGLRYRIWIESAEAELFQLVVERPGSGLGLPFVARVVQAHGGALHIDSTLGRGTVVRMSFPVAVDGNRSR